MKFPKIIPLPGLRGAVGSMLAGCFVAAMPAALCAACGGYGAAISDDGGRMNERAERGIVARNELVRSEIIPLLREGDVVFRRGGGVVSRAVLAADRGGTYSHVGVAARVDGTMMIVHVVPGERGEGGARDAVRIDTPEEFFSPANAGRGAVMRLRRDSSAENGLRTDEITGRAARSAVRLTRAGVLFDHRYDLADTARMYCTELVWHVFRAGGVDLSGGRRTRAGVPGVGGTYIMPSDVEAAPELGHIYVF